MPRSRHLFVTLLAACSAGPAPSDDTDSDVAPPPTCAESGSPYAHDDTLTASDVQALGTHNSYHLRPDQPLDASHEYTQPPLAEQLALGVRAFELDVHRRVDGVFTVLHLPVIDPLTSCDTFEDCLRPLWTWSLAHPCHAPLMVWIEPKDEDIDAGFPDEYQLYQGDETAIDDVIRGVWPAGRLFEPDMLRGEHATLSGAVTQDGWPTLGAMRGQTLFAMLDSGDHRTSYLDGAPSLQGRAMFVDADTVDDAFAATFKIDNAQGQAALVTQVVQAGFLVTSNVDGPEDSAEDNAAKLAASLAAGSNYLATNFPGAPGDAAKVSIPGGQPARCNPVRSAVACVSEDIEALTP